MEAMTATDTWMPGDPIYDRYGRSAGWIRQLIEIIPDHRCDEEPHLGCGPDGCAARWPHPYPHQDLKR
jgi:hypothetical protein